MSRLNSAHTRATTTMAMIFELRLTDVVLGGATRKQKEPLVVALSPFSSSSGKMSFFFAGWSMRRLVGERGKNKEGACGKTARERVVLVGCLGAGRGSGVEGWLVLAVAASVRMAACAPDRPF
nr:hypothetical protein [Pandoravirus belohorizontensis]